MKRTRLYIFFALVCSHAYATAPVVDQWLQDAIALGSTPLVEEEAGNYSRIRMADSCYLEVQDMGDSLLVVRTVCAPICSSAAALYTPSGQLLHPVLPTTTAAVFPEAHIVSGTLVWTDNTTEILDENEKKHYNAVK